MASQARVASWRARPPRFPIGLAASGRPGAVIVSGPETRAAAARLRDDARAALGVELPVLADVDVSAETEPGQHVVAVGNMANNAFLRGCYGRYWCLTDRETPGPGGHEIRTLHAPWGGRRSVVLCGASDAAGLEDAVARLAQIVRSTGGVLGPTIDVQLGAGWDRVRARIDEVDDRPLPARLRFGLMEADELEDTGAYYYLSGRASLGAKYRECWLRMADDHPERIAEEQVHLRFAWKVLLWDLTAETAAFSDADRGRIGRYIAEVLDGEEGIRHHAFVRRRQAAAPRQNHQTLTALSLLFGARYFRRAFEGAEVDEWESVARRLFAVYDHHWRPVCDSMGHGFTTTSPDVLTADLLGTGLSYVRNGGLRRMAELSLLCCNNLGRMPLLGDTDDNVWPTEVLAAAASIYRDGRYRWMLERGKKHREVRYALHTRLARRWADDVEPSPPVDLVGLRVMPLDKLYYDMPATDPDYARQFYVLPPNVPHERTFDKLSFRSGLGADDQYVLLDGIAGGSHSFDDTNSIVEFCQDGRAWLVTEDNLHWPQQTNHNLVTVVRDGKSAQIPSFADLQLARSFAGSAFTLSAVHAYSGADWRRGIVWRRGDYLLVLDEVEAREPGNYTVEARYRALGEHAFDERGFTVAQGEARFTIAHDGADSAWREPVDVSVASVWNPELVAARRERYGIWPLVLSMLHLSTERDLRPGERVSIAAALHARPGATAPVWRPSRIGRLAARLERDGAVEYAGHAAEGSLRAGDLDVAAAAFRIGRQTLALADATHLALKGAVVLAASAPIDLELDREAGTATVRASASTTVRLLDGAAAAAGVRLDGTRPLPAGEHRIDGLSWEGIDLTAGLDVPAAGGTRPRPARSVGRLRAERLGAVPTPTCVARLADGTLAVGGRGGDLVLIDAAGSIAWRAAVPGEILTVALGDLDGDGLPDVLAGGAGCAIHALGPEGRERWTFRPAYGLQYWPWWTLGESRIHKLLVDDLDADGRPEILAGVANMRLHCLDADGGERWQVMTEHGVFKTFVTADLDGDGRREIVGGNDLLSSSSVVRVIDADGRQIRAFPNQGWTAQVRAVLVADLDGDGALEVACGTNREQSLRVHAADGSGLRWGHNLGDAVSGLALVRRPDGPLLVAASRSFYVSAFEPASGTTAWTANVGHAAAALALVGDRLLVGTEDGRVVALDLTGRVLAEAPLGGVVSRVVPDDDGRALALGEGVGLWRVDAAT